VGSKGGFGIPLGPALSLRRENDGGHLRQAIQPEFLRALRAANALEYLTRAAVRSRPGPALPATTASRGSMASRPAGLGSYPRGCKRLSAVKRNSTTVRFEDAFSSRTSAPGPPNMVSTTRTLRDAG